MAKKATCGSTARWFAASQISAEQTTRVCSARVITPIMATTYQATNRGGGGRGPGHHTGGAQAEVPVQGPTVVKFFPPPPWSMWSNDPDLFIFRSGFLVS